MSTLSIFIDESGDFGEIKERPSYYLVSLVFHNQDIDIDKEVRKLEASTKASGFEINYIHTGPIIRREAVFSNMSIDDRRKLIYKLLNFYNSVDIRHTTIIVDRKSAADKISLSGKLSRSIKEFLEKNRDFFSNFEKVIVYYDYGQSELSSVLNAVLSFWFEDIEFRKAEPSKYRLLQVADFVCSLELLKIKFNEKRLSNSEKAFFYKSQELKKTFFKSIERKKL